MTLYFLDRFDNKRLLKENLTTKEEAEKEMKKFMDEHNFTSYYSRTWRTPENDGTMYDVGSHSEFFLLEDK